MSSSFATYLRLDGSEGPGLHNAVAQQLETAIAVGLLVPGERLPPESELAAELGVSTGTLRQALEALRQNGVLHTRRGRGGGSFVRSPSDVERTAALSRLRQRSSDELRDLGDECATVLGGTAWLAAQRAAEDDVARLRGFAGSFRDAGTPDERRRADSRFFIEIGVVAHSVRLTKSIVQLHGELVAMLWVSEPDDEVGRARTPRVHDALVAAIGEGRGEDARAAAVGHVDDRVQHLIGLHLELLAGGDHELPRAGGGR